MFKCILIINYIPVLQKGIQKGDNNFPTVMP